MKDGSAVGRQEVTLYSPEVCAVLDKLSEGHYDSLSTRLRTAKKSPSQQFALQTSSEASCKDSNHGPR